jgi:hypothetical protein
MIENSLHSRYLTYEIFFSLQISQIGMGFIPYCSRKPVEKNKRAVLQTAAAVLITSRILCQDPILFAPRG